jgi:hypothetical protein
MVNQKELNITLEEKSGLSKEYTSISKPKEIYSIVPQENFE